MATRSRRSGAGSEGGLNPAMIHFLDTGRLRKELTQRGLDTTGSKSLLADRLQEAVNLERMGGQRSYSPPPINEKSPKKAVTKRVAKVKEEVDSAESPTEVTSPPAKRRKKSNAVPLVDEIEIVEESFSIEFTDDVSSDLVIVTPPAESDESEAEQDVKPTITKEKRTSSGRKTRSPRRKAQKTDTPTTARSPRKKRKEIGHDDVQKQTEVEVKIEPNEEVNQVEAETPRESTQQEEGVKKKTEERDKKEGKEHRHKKSVLLKLKIDSETVVRKAEVETRAPLTAQKSASSEEAETREQSGSSEKSVHKGEKEAKRVLVRAASDAGTGTRSKSTGSASPSSQISPSSSSSDVSRGKPSTESGAEKSEKAKESTPSETDKKKMAAVRKKVPLRMQAPVDVLDSIFDKQTKLLSSKFKSEQEKAAERQMMEIEKRRLSGGSTVGLGPMMDRRRHSVNTPALSTHSSSPRIQPTPLKKISFPDDRMQLSRLPAPPPPPQLPPPPPPLLPPPTRLPPPPPPPLIRPMTSSIQRVPSDITSPTAHPRRTDHGWTDHASEADALRSHTHPRRPDGWTPSDITSPTAYTHSRRGDYGWTPSEAELSPLSRPPSVPPYSSPSTLPDVPSTSAISAQLSTSDLSPDRIKEMASALQAVFARMGSAAAMRADTQEGRGDGEEFDTPAIPPIVDTMRSGGQVTSQLVPVTAVKSCVVHSVETPMSSKISPSVTGGTGGTVVSKVVGTEEVSTQPAAHSSEERKEEKGVEEVGAASVNDGERGSKTDGERVEPVCVESKGGVDDVGRELGDVTMAEGAECIPASNSSSGAEAHASGRSVGVNATSDDMDTSSGVTGVIVSSSQSDKKKDGDGISEQCKEAVSELSGPERRSVEVTVAEVVTELVGTIGASYELLSLNEGTANMHSQRSSVEESHKENIPQTSNDSRTGAEQGVLNGERAQVSHAEAGNNATGAPVTDSAGGVVGNGGSTATKRGAEQVDGSVRERDRNVADETSQDGSSSASDSDAAQTEGTTPKSPDDDSKSDDTASKPEICEQLLRDPRLLLKKASDVLKHLNSQDKSDEHGQQHYEQCAPDPDYEVEEEDKPLPEFHGEPVPDSDDDVIIEGVSRRRSNAARRNTMQEEEPIPGDEHVELDFYNADLHIKASETDPMVIDPDNGDGFALMWGGVRATYGIRVPDSLDDFPVIAFQAKVLENLSLKHIPFDEVDAFDVRFGWSLQNAQGILGESAHSYSFSSTARKALGNVFTDYGEPFQIGDVVTTAVDLARGEITYWINKQCLGVAFSEVHLMAGEVLFPHLCTKNCKVAVNFGAGKPEEWLGLDELEQGEGSTEYKKMIYIGEMDKERLKRGPVAPASKGDCTVLMMVGLPGVGKTTWVRQYLKDHPHEQWTLLSTDIILNAMKVNGVSRSRVHQGRWDMVMGLTAKALTRSLHLACRRRRNYIIDQTNVAKDARRRKLSQFKDFQRKCVVIIPTEEEMLNRQLRQSRAEGVGQIPVEAMLELKASFSIPNVELEPVEDVYFVEPPLERIGDAIELVARFNEEARPWCQKKRGRRGDRGYGSHDYSRGSDNRQSNFRSSSDSANFVPRGDMQQSAQPRANEGYCGFGATVPPSLVPTPALWAEHKNVTQ